MANHQQVNQRYTDLEPIVRLLEQTNRLLENIDGKLRKIVINTNGK